ncbi:hypothetical protein [Alkalicoccobacillus gibsonii]|uniref:hypothetical protein n=1 Tax=Alkalicoccobacillus gibsonii TaxID=79881 RepID=UPI001933DD57|nr:hypothetical protein [Alkalicoccobacillus gibsonii]MBM0065512.1 hypothetical protein [Alkalicoccobacillus gibsonii]
MIQYLFHVATGLVYIFLFNTILISVVNTKYLRNKNLEIKYLAGYLGTLLFAVGVWQIWSYFELTYILFESLVYGGIIVGFVTCAYAFLLYVLRLAGKDLIYTKLSKPLND